jgi:hypothetical protein
MARSLINSAGARQRCRKLTFASFGAVTRLARTRGTVIALGAIALACVAWLAIAARASTASVSPTPVAVVTLSGQSRAIPRSFFGLSIEDKELAKYEAEEPLFDRMISHLAPLNGSRMLLRLGGRSADEVFWDTRTTGQPRWVEDLDPAWMARLVKLARGNKLRIELDLNMAVHSPKMEAAFARAAKKALGWRLVGLALGNEPDLYRHESWLEKERARSTIRSTPRHWTHHYAIDQYRDEYREYARAVLKVVPGMPLTAPELTFPSLAWPEALVNLGRLTPSSLSFHRYATATCNRAGHPPTPAAFLSNRYTKGLANTLGNDIAFAQQQRLEIRVTEMNSVTCGGRKNLAESFSTSLWAPDALFEMLRAGIDGVNWHIRPTYANAPFQFNSHGVVPLPEFYGLAVFTNMLGPHAVLQETDVQSSPQPVALKAWAVRSSRGLRMLLINKGSTDISTRLELGAGQHSAQIRRLLAPTLTSRSGVTFAGQSIGSDGSWHGHIKRITVESSASGTYSVKMPAYSAAVIDLGRI